MNDNPFSPHNAGPLPDKLKELEQPMHEVLSGFIHGCSPEPATRTAATAAFVLSLWQLGGRGLTTHLPSMLLVRQGEDGPDPIDDFVRSLISDERENKPRVRIGGYGRSRRYSKAWHPEAGLLTDADDQVILRLDEDEDRSGFCRDLLEDPEKILFPQGIVADPSSVGNTISISGSLTTNLWRGKHAGTMLASGLPFFVLPHVSDAPLRETGLHALRCFAMIWQSARLHPVEADLRLPGSDWVRCYLLALRERLAVLPVPTMFPTLQVIHQLDGICRGIVDAARGPNTPEDEAIALYRDLYHHTIRGIVIGMASHLWFGVGLMPGKGHDYLREKAGRLLRRLRREGPVTMTDLLKNFHFKKHERDPLLEQLAGQGLLRIDESTVTATSYREFVEWLYARDEFPAVERQRDLVSAETGD